MAFRATGCNKKLRFSLFDLPAAIIVDILLQLSVESVVFCKCMCKFLHEIVSDPQFAKLYFARPTGSDVYLFVRPISSSHISRTLYLVHPRLYMFEISSKMKPETTFKIPLHNLEKILDSVKLNQCQSGIKRKQCLKLISEDHKFDIVNSCNGFLCLSRKNAVVICNPITGEFVNLSVPPMPAYDEHFVRYEFGFNPSTKCYKVIRLFNRSTDNRSPSGSLTKYSSSTSSFAQIQIFGSRSWKNIGLGPYFSSLSKSTFFSGTLNWICYGVLPPKVVANFDCISDQFGLFSLPPCFAAVPKLPAEYNFKLGVLWDCLCFYKASVYDNFEVWKMREYGFEGSWTKVCKVGFQEQLGVGRYDIYTPITGLENGAFLMFHYRNKTKCGVIYCEPETQRLRYNSVKGIIGRYEAIGFTPRFNLLKDALVGDELEVLNVKSRCAELKIYRDSVTPFVVQENIS